MGAPPTGRPVCDDALLAASNRRAAAPVARSESVSAGTWISGEGTTDQRPTDGTRAQGKRYEDKGVIVQLQPGRRLQFSHFSPLSGLPDAAENYHTVTIELSHTPPITHVSLSQDNNASEQSREHSEKNWQTMLSGLKALLEK
jgi:uncharacterized protein YndB with AHSA1/START domain